MLATVAPLFLLAAAAAAQSTTTLCVAGQCLEGTSNISIGAIVSAAGSDQQLVLLPGAYAATTDPESLRNTLAASSSRLSFAPGFAPNGTTAVQSVSFPLNVALQPGILSTTASLFRGQTQYSAVPASPPNVNDSSVTVPAGGSLVLSADVWAAFTSATGDSRLVLWDSVADLAQLPSAAGQSTLTLVGLQSTKCTPSCSGNGICTAAGTCVCPEGSGFTGPSCESCLENHFGPDCLPCPEDCAQCDAGPTGSGKCLVPAVANAPATCNCANGVCGPNGACECSSGWEDGTNGLKCSKCAAGFFKTSAGNCEVCENGCTQCQDSTGTCTQCSSGLVVDANNSRKCVIDTTGATQVCPDKTFPNGNTCSFCSNACETCTGSGANACLRCASGTYKLDGLCVPTDQQGVCSGSQRVANNVKGTCDACPVGCSSCGISAFSAASTFDQVQCTGCLPGLVLSEGKCTATCPSGTFISKTDGFTCTACDSTCSTCVDDAKFCLTCSGSGLANGGTCGTTCPTGTFKSDGACLPCHGDCASCSGAGFDQCTACSASRPVLQATGTAQAGRCLPTCGKSQFLDSSTNKCQACDSACSSCSGSGPNQCLACSNAGQVLQGGTCVDAKCERGSGVVPGLGACLSALVAAPFVDNAPVPSPSTPTPAPVPTSSRRLAWWEILLMALGCAFITLMFILCWRRRMRQKRAARTAAFAKNIQSRGVFSRGMHWLGDKLFHHRVQEKDVDGMVARMRATELERHKHEMELLETRARAAGAGHGKWDWTREPSIISDRETFRREERSRAASPQPSLPGHNRYETAGLDVDPHANRLSAPSLYSVMTGAPRTTPEPRQPLRDNDVPPLPMMDREANASRFSVSTGGTSLWRSVSQRAGPYERMEQPRYDVIEVRQHRTGDSYESHHSNSSAGSSRGENRNPFRR